MRLIPKSSLTVILILLVLPSNSFSATLKGELVGFYPATWEIRGIGSAVWIDGELVIHADGIIIDLLTGNLVAFGDVLVERDDKTERYDVFYTKELVVKTHKEIVIPYILAREAEIDWKSTTITLKDVKLNSGITFQRLSFPFGPYSSRVGLSLSEEIISVDTSSPYVSILTPYNGGVFTQVLTPIGMEISYEREDYFLLGAKTYVTAPPSIYGEYTFYSKDKSLGITVGYNQLFYNILTKKIHKGLWLYTGILKVDWKDSPQLTISISAEDWDRLKLKGEIFIDTSTGEVEFNPYVGYRFDIARGLTLDIFLSKIGLESLKFVYSVQPTVNVKLGYIRPERYIFGIEWGYRGVELVNNSGILSLIMK